MRVIRIWKLRERNVIKGLFFLFLLILKRLVKIWSLFNVIYSSAYVLGFLFFKYRFLVSFFICRKIICIIIIISWYEVRF